MNKKKRILITFLFLLLFGTAHPAYADLGLVASGVAKTLFSAVQIPKDMMANAGTAFPIGLLVGAVSGAVKTVIGTGMGAFDIARGAAPYAKYLIFL